MTPSTDDALRRLADRCQIEDLMLRLARAIDRLDLDGIRDAFHAGAIDRHGMYNGDVEGFIQWLSTRHESIGFSMHALSNMLIEFASSDVAVVETYCQGLQRHLPAADRSGVLLPIAGNQESPLGLDVTVYCRYVDVVDRREGVWRIRERTVVFDSIRTQPVSEGAPQPGADWIVGKRRGKSDHLYQARAAVGLRDDRDS